MSRSHVSRSVLPLLGSLVLLFIVSAPIAAQARGTIQGEVRAANTQRPLVGVQVFIPGTNFGVLTNSAGRYTLAVVPAGPHTVRAQMLGYAIADKSVTVAADQSVTADFILTETAVSLDQIVVTGTAGQARTREVGNSVSSISEREIEVAPVRNTQDIIGARATGVTVMATSGQPGAGGTIRLRGNKSVSMGNEPLIYVDGVRLYSRVSPASGSARQGTLPINDIAADDIERVEIVKGAAATTLYGTEASGGVIQIFTKRGRAGTPAWSAELSGGLNSLKDIGPEGDATGLFLKQCRGPNLIDSQGGKFEDATCPANGTWLRNGAIQRLNVSVRGGAPELTYYLSGNYNREQGVISDGYSNDGGFRGNFSFRPRSGLDFTMNSAYIKRKTRWIPDGNLANGFTLNVMRGPSNNFKDASKCATTGLIACTTNGEILNQEVFNNNDHFVSGLTVRYEPSQKVAQRFTVGYDYNAADNFTVIPFGFSRLAPGQISTQGWNHTTLSLDYVGTYRHEIAGIGSNFSWGGQLFEDRNRQTNVTGSDFAGPGQPTLTSSARQQVTTDEKQRVINAGFFFQEMLSWNDRLFVTAGLRVDGNSAFGESFGLQPYPKLSASYVISEMPGWPSQIETMKLRAAVGESGKAPGAFDAVRTWEPIAADEAKPGFTPDQLGNADLGPERTREYEVGFDASAFNGRLGVELTYFYQNTIDALIQVQYPPSQGFTDRQLENIGELKNQGLELRLDAGLLQTRLLDWRARINLSTNNSEAVDLNQEVVSTGSQSWVKEGFSVPGIYGFEVLNRDKFEDPVLSTKDTVFYGPIYPTRIIGMGTTLTLKGNLTLDLLGEFQGGHYLQNWTGYQNANRNVWRPCYDIQKALRANDVGFLANVTAIDRGRCAVDRTKQNDDFFIEKADFFKLRTLSLSYQLPARLVPGTRSATITLAGRNLLKVTDYTGIDPEVADRGDAGLNGLSRREYYNLPPVSAFLASLRVNF